MNLCNHVCLFNNSKLLGLSAQNTPSSAPRFNYLLMDQKKIVKKIQKLSVKQICLDSDTYTNKSEMSNGCKFHQKLYARLKRFVEWFLYHLLKLCTFTLYIKIKHLSLYLMRSKKYNSSNYFLSKKCKWDWRLFHIIT